MSERKRLHPIAAIWNFLKQLKGMIFPLLVLLVGSNGIQSYWDYFPMGITVISIVFALAAGIIKWRRFTYRLEDGELRIEYGLFVKKKRFIPFDRIQSFHFSQSILHRPFGLTRVEVETAGSTDNRKSEAELTAIYKHDAEWLEQTIRNSKKSQSMILESSLEDDQKTSAEAFIYKVAPRELLLMATTSGGIGVVLSGVFALWTQFDEYIPYQEIFDEMGKLVHNSIILISAAIFIGFFLVWLISIFITMLKYGNFTVRKDNDDIIITRGLVERKQITIPMKRVQAVRVAENILRQPFGFATVHLISAGGSVFQKESAAVMVLPIIKKKRIPEIMNNLLPDFGTEPEFARPPRRSLLRYVIIGEWKALIAAGALTWFLWPWGSLACILPLLAFVLAWSKYKAAGWAIDGHRLALQYRSIGKNTFFMNKNRIQSMQTKQSWFQQKNELETIKATVKSGEAGRRVTVKYIESKDASHIYEWFTPAASQASLKKVES
ncbi:PH domain-containing protein [Falsibacillus albus]|uniref:YdbS-like PH domain-containing protein n=1 Tax=Falsibacillus albus TaxID=2478915 RepID=A0A3L7JXU2_9BACI|nr:PH domain-containing protein [Falsibacillus albus]RLQ93252.1 hypothetical protein D9X91_18255 [Falsibacillus albus]